MVLAAETPDRDCEIYILPKGRNIRVPATPNGSFPLATVDGSVASLPVGQSEDGTEDVAEEVMDAAVEDALDHRAHPRDPQRFCASYSSPSSKPACNISKRYSKEAHSGLAQPTVKEETPKKKPKAIEIFDKALDTFCDWHDMHGLYFLRNRKNLGATKWLIWVVVECSFISWALYLCYSPFMNLINGKHTVSIDMDGALLKRRLLPDITICPTNPIRKDAAQELGVDIEILTYAMGAVNRGDALSQKIRIDEVRRDRLEAELNDILERNQTTIPHFLFAASLRYSARMLVVPLQVHAADIIRCEDMILSCELGGESRILEAEQCCVEIFKSRPLTSMGPCISTHGYTRYQNYPGASMGLSVVLRVFSSSWLDRNTLSGVAHADGYKVILTASYESPSLAPRIRAHSVNPGRKTLLGLQVVRVEHSGMNVYPVRSNVCGDVDVTMAPNKSVHDLMDHYPYSWNCVERIFRDATINSSCKCYPADIISSEELMNMTIPVCSPETYMWCIRQEVASDQFADLVYERAEKECKPLCTESSYAAMVTNDHLNPTYVESLTKQLGYNLTPSEDVAMIGVHYSMLSERVISYSAYAIIDLISSTGGILGLIFGGSCMTVIQFITFNVWLSRRFVMWGNKRMRESETRNLVLASLDAAKMSGESITPFYPENKRRKGLTTQDCLFV
ncbi:unnamed protein product [Darwinula stevensoni]|uniref:Amiloride-sensitive sodium channel n=1 Tax=Darwinula stevensoni TaxID=69355 RepID=A0A7R9A8R5_9CRUS|nr:unnamed protein product [Darwinula stevensoni]CAG0896660.1 unnamed protein product [Darwinula stevensoni]